jgi:hypothetical protein
MFPNDDRRSVCFGWGNESPGTKHLAQAILLDYAGENAMRRHAHDFMIEVVSKLPTPWSFESDKIAKWLKRKNEVGQSVQKACSAPPRSEEPPPPTVPLRPSDFPNFPVDPLKRDRPKGPAPA